MTLINAAISSNILRVAEQKVVSQLTPATFANFQKIVVAGTKAGMHGGPDSILASLRDSKNPIQECAIGALNLVAVLSRQSRGTMPVKAAVPAAMVLMLRALDFANQAKIVKVGPDELNQAARIFANQIFHYMHVTPQMMQTAATRIHGIVNDPAKLELVKRASGVVKHPLASTPTPLPE